MKCNTKATTALTTMFGAAMMSFFVSSTHAIADEVSADVQSNTDNIIQLATSVLSKSSKPDIVFHEVEGVKLLADFYRPANNSRVPIVLMIHGGGWITGTRRQIMIHANRLTAAGFAVLSIEYRLAPKHKFPAQLDDVQAAIRYIQEQADALNVDANRLVIWGYSAGGHLAALAATNPKEGLARPKVCVAGGAPCDFTTLPEDNATLAPFLGGSRREVPEVYSEASPTTHASPDDPPTFFFHGDSDLLVPDANSQRLFDKLISCKVPTERFIAKDQGHMATFINLQAIDQAISFVKKHLSL
jgi:triacylglycerol lipase